MGREDGEAMWKIKREGRREAEGGKKGVTGSGKTRIRYKGRRKGEWVQIGDRKASVDGRKANEKELRQEKSERGMKELKQRKRE